MFGFSKLIQKLRQRSPSSFEINPDEVLLDAHNLPEFNEAQFEGRFETPIRSTQLKMIVVAFFVITMLFGGRLWYLQMYHVILSYMFALL